MPISRNEAWIRLAELNERDEIVFTVEFRTLMGELGWEAKAFVSHLLALWYDPFEHLLDYTSGEATASQDQPGAFDRNELDKPQEVVEYWATLWSEHGKDHTPSHEAGPGLALGIEWHRDILRAKLVSLRLPKRLLLAYHEKALERRRALERTLRSVKGIVFGTLTREEIYDDVVSYLDSRAAEARLLPLGCRLMPPLGAGPRSAEVRVIEGLFVDGHSPQKPS